MNHKRRTFYLGILLATAVSLGFLFVSPVLAEGPVDQVGFESFAEQAGFSSTADVRLIITRLIRTFLGFLGVIAVLIVLYAGTLWMTAGGNEERIKKAKKLLSNGLIGLVIILLSFAITHFIVGRLVSSLGGGISGGGAPDDGYCENCGIPSGQFALESVNTECASKLQNFQLQMVFSQKVMELGALNGGIEIKQGDKIISNSDNLELSADGRMVTFRPDTPCPDPYSAERCFAPNTKHTVTFEPTILKNQYNKVFSCPNIGCDFNFTTGSGIDIDPPFLTLQAPMPSGSDVIQGGLPELIKVKAIDDVEVSMVNFIVENELIDVDDQADDEVYFQTSPDQWNTQGYDTGDRYDIWAEGFDCAGHQAESESVWVTLRAPNCGNGVLDPDYEDQIDCGGDSRSDNYCGACDGQSCSSDDDCAKGRCIDNVCVSHPKIKTLSPGDGAVGNLITIIGEGFGSYSPGSSQVLINESVNLNPYECSGVISWQDDQIIIQVTEAMGDGGPIMVKNAAGEIDATNDDYGPLIADFVVNDIVRPGVCRISPESGLGGNPAKIIGNNFQDSRGSSTVYFGSYQSSAYQRWQNNNIVAVVPIVNGGNFYTQVFVGDNACSISGKQCTRDRECTLDEEICVLGREGSNTVKFEILSVADNQEPPKISRVDTGWSVCQGGFDEGTFCSVNEDCDSESCVEALNWGPSGQSVTIYGSNFGTSAGRVWFERDDGSRTLAVADFPEACGNDFWHDTYVTVKVPQGATTDTIALYLDRGIEPSSNKVDFTVVNDIPGPSICLIEPSGGPEGTVVNLHGENFGDRKPRVGAGHPQIKNAPDDYIIFNEDKFVSVAEVNWTDVLISNVVVPDQALTGPVYVRNSERTKSNSVPFSVGRCDVDFGCEEGLECCATGVCAFSCESVGPVESHYAYMFSTAEIPDQPVVAVGCNNSVVSPSPWSGWSSDVCINAKVTASFVSSWDSSISIEMNPTSFTSDNVKIQKCQGTVETGVCNEDDLEPNEFSSGTIFPAFSESTAAFSSFEWDPSGHEFEQNQAYLITLIGGEGGLQSTEGEWLREDFSWSFTTRNTGDHCAVGSVIVDPTEFTAKTKEQKIGYLAKPIAADDACVVLSCNGIFWQWSAFPESHASLANNAVIDQCDNIATALQETRGLQDDAVSIQATAAPEDAVQGDQVLVTGLPGATEYYNDSIKFEDGTIMNPDNTLDFIDESTREANGTYIFKSGLTILPDDSVTLPGGIRIMPDFTIILTEPLHVSQITNLDPNTRFAELLGDTGELYGGETVIPPTSYSTVSLPGGIIRYYTSLIYPTNSIAGGYTMYFRNPAYQSYYTREDRLLNRTNSSLVYLSGPSGSARTIYRSAGNSNGNIYFHSRNMRSFYPKDGRIDLTDGTNIYFSGLIKYSDGRIGNWQTSGGFGTETGEALLHINFSDPEVTDYWPNCANACRNAAIGASFNIPMNQGYFTKNNIKVNKCESSDGVSTCSGATVLDIFENENFSYEPTESGLGVRSFLLSLPVGQTFESNTFYEVRLSRWIRSYDGSSLNDSYNSDFTWIFKTKSTESICSVDRVEVRPEDVVKDKVGERQEYLALPFGAPDECSKNGQILSASNLSWSAWTAQDKQPEQSAEDIVTLLAGGALMTSADLPLGCSSDCTHTGVTIKHGDPVCGDGDDDADNNGMQDDGEDCDDGNTIDGDGCSSNCLIEGNEAETCGNGTYQPNLFEECDDGNRSNGDGCSSKCTNEGAVGGVRDCSDDHITHDPSTGGEECADGNTDSGDGCSALCLNEGSIAVEEGYSVCGNGGDPEPGEDCDDGNTVSGDGCSEFCLNEGAKVCAFQCYDTSRGEFEPGKNCRPGVAEDCRFDRICRAVESPCCGDTFEETGEDCDDGNIEDGDGCSSSCLSEGSSPYYSDPDDPAVTASFCGDTFEGTGEECEAAGTADIIRPYSVAEINYGAVQEVDDSSKLAVSTITATTGTVSGDTTLSLQCACVDDLSCGDPSLLLGCGISGCCFDRPVINSHQPADGQTDTCRNTAVTLTADQLLDPNSFVVDGEPMIYLELLEDKDGNRGVDNCPIENGYFLVPLPPQEDGVIGKVWGWIKGIFGRVVQAEAPAGSDPWTDPKCVTSATLSIEGNLVRINYANALLENAWYRIILLGDRNIETDGQTQGVTSIYGVGFAEADYKVSFKTGTEICELEKVEVEDLGRVESISSEIEMASSEFFTKSGEEHLIIASGLTIRDNGREEEIQQTTDYNWTWSWHDQVNPDDDENVDVIEIDPNDPDYAAESKKSLAISKSEDGSEYVFAKAVTNQQILDATDQPLTDDDGNLLYKTVIGSVDLTALLCENPWPSADIYRHSQTNYGFSYCRDAGEPDDFTDDLPGLRIQNIPRDESLRLGIEYETLFPLEDDNGLTGDALGVRVISNPDYLPPDLWFDEQGFSGGPSAMQLDGYEAVQDRQTTYVFAANYFEPTDGTLPTIYPNIYIVSFNENASEEARQVFDQIIENWEFNANANPVTDINLCAQMVGGEIDYLSDPVTGSFVSCTWDGQCAQETCDPQTLTCTSTGNDCRLLDEDGEVVEGEDGNNLPSNSRCPLSSASGFCDAQKAKLTRDTKRLSDVVRMERTINAKTSTECLVDSANLVRNSDFSQGVYDNWYFYFKNYDGGSANAAVAIDNSKGNYISSPQSVMVSVKDGGDGAAHVQYHGGISYENSVLQNGKSYTLGFYAKADQNITKDVTVLRDGVVVSTNPEVRDFTSYFNQSFDLTTSWKKFEYNFTYSGIEDNRIRIDFFLGNTDNVVYWIDDVTLTENKQCIQGVPRLESGSFVRAMSTSAWPSWSAALGNEIGAALPQDPLNQFTACEQGADKDTCWDGVENRFACEEGSHIYGFRSEKGERYSLYVDLEMSDAPWAYPIDSNSSDQINILAGRAGSEFTLQPGFVSDSYLCRGVDGSSAWGDSVACGDGLIGVLDSGESEACELGDVMIDTEECTNGIRRLVCQNVAGVCEYVEDIIGCIPFACGNGIIETGEKCDDGELNGTYGHCAKDCKEIGPFYCGDGELAGGEQCDAGDDNGVYTSSFSNKSLNCAFDCTFPGPSCGDKIINGPEQCDGNYQVWAKGLCSSDKRPCEADLDCGEGQTCGATCPTEVAVCIGGNKNGQACVRTGDCTSGVPDVVDSFFEVDDKPPGSDTITIRTIDPVCSSAVCVRGSNAGGDCTAEGDKDCPGGLCGSFTYDLQRVRTCQSDCDWGTGSGWSECVRPDQYCGNGVKEGNEVCDDGNEENNDACTNICQENVCGDGSVYAGVESCDAGVANGTTCDPIYGTGCTYCNEFCQLTTVTGDFCGDGKVTGNEVCDGNLVASSCYDSTNRDEDGTCDNDSDCQSGTCVVLGICNGGNDNGLPCDLSNGNNDCQGVGECVRPVCADNCLSMCPFQFRTDLILAQEIVAGSSPQTEIDIYSLQSGDTPDRATIQIPACSVGTQLIADITVSSDYVPPSIDIVFVTDLSGSMSTTVTSGTCLGNDNVNFGKGCDQNSDCTDYTNYTCVQDPHYCDGGVSGATCSTATDRSSECSNFGVCTKLQTCKVGSPNENEVCTSDNQCHEYYRCLSDAGGIFDGNLLINQDKYGDCEDGATGGGILGCRSDRDCGIKIPYSCEFSADPPTICVGGPNDGDSDCENDDECSIIGDCVLPELHCSSGAENTSPGQCTEDTEYEDCYKNFSCDLVTDPTEATRIEIVVDSMNQAIDKLFASAIETGTVLSVGLVSYEGEPNSPNITIDQNLVGPNTSSSYLVDLKQSIDSYIDRVENGRTPTAQGLAKAFEVLSTSTADMKYVILMSDGIPTGGETPVIEVAKNSLGQILDYRKSIRLFTAVITDQTDLEGFMAHLSDDICPTENYTNNDYRNPNVCEKADNVEYAYAATSADEINSMYDDIVDNVMGITATVVSENCVDDDSDYTTAPVCSTKTTSEFIERKNDQILPFPDNFKCTGSLQSLPFTMNFNGQGGFNLSDFRFTYCPAP
ncbi:IPT/TIG domain-containing protein [Patescibacteria group bacterium]